MSAFELYMLLFMFASATGIAYFGRLIENWINGPHR